MLLEKGSMPWRASLVRSSSQYAECKLDPWSGNIQESTNECINKWNKKTLFLSLSLSRPLSLKSINLSKFF